MFNRVSSRENNMNRAALVTLNKNKQVFNIYSGRKARRLG